EELKRQLTEDLMEYSACKEAAFSLNQLKDENAVYVRKPMEIKGGYTYKIPHDVMALMEAITVSMGRIIRQAPPDEKSFTGLVKKKIVSVESRIIYLLGIFYKKAQLSFDAVFRGSSSKSELIATFLALLELIKDKRVRVSEDGESFSFTTDAPLFAQQKG
ncbi:MAG: segregation/condensation protein A, partial [Oscillospiraceae bacterium]